MNSEPTPEASLALLQWQIELGADEATGDQPVNRYDLPKQSAPRKATSAPITAETADPVVVAKSVAAGAGDLEALRASLDAFEHCALKQGARNLVFCDGFVEARLMIIGEAPGRDEDIQGKPFVGRAGQLLDRMLIAIDHDRQNADPDQGVYITNVLPWRPPQNRDPTKEEMAMMRPFVERHVALVDPDVVVLMGNISCEVGLGVRGITRLRGKWTEAYGKPCLPMFHPAYLLRNPAAKREAWADLLELDARLRGKA
ncbi:MAG: uracil-DNA glycosylase [Pseudomonadota bacterium]